MIAYRAGDFAVFLFGFADQRSRKHCRPGVGNFETIAAQWLGDARKIAEDADAGILIEVTPVDVDFDFGPRWRQRHRAVRAHAVVSRTVAAGASRNRRHTGGAVGSTCRSCFPVQWVNRPNPDFRGYAGTVMSGSIAPGNAIAVAGRSNAAMSSVLTYEGAQAVGAGRRRRHHHARRSGRRRARRRSGEPDGHARNIGPVRRQRDLDGRRAADARPLLSGAHWHQDHAAQRHGHQIQDRRQYPRASVGRETLGLNDIGFCNLSTASAVAFDPYERNRRTGSFIVIDRFTNQTVGAGMIAFGLRRGTNIQWQPLSSAKASARR